MKEFTIRAAEDGQRIDVALAARLDASRAKIQTLIKAGGVSVNGRTANAHAVVREGDTVSHPPLPRTKRTRAEAVDIPILYEDADVVVVEKPAGIIVHPMNETDLRPSAIGSLLATRPGLRRVGENPLRPGVVHRLDRDVSGVMVVAKSQKAFEDLKRQFGAREIEKEYVALVYGKLPKDADVINFKIARSKTLGRMVSRPEGQEGKEAITEYDVTDRFKTATLLRVSIKTGRTHQIRAHFKAVGHSVVGDTLYRTKIVNIRPIPLDRLFLHAARLSFVLPDGTRKTFVSDLPEDLNALLTQLPRS